VTVTIVFWDGYVGAAPSIVNGIRMLEEAGFRVELLTREPDAGFPAVPTFSEATRVAVCRPWSAAWAGRGLPGRRPSFERNIRTADRQSAGWIARAKALVARWLGTLLLVADLLQFRYFVRHRTADNQRRFWIGVDLLGSLVAARHARPDRFAYWSLEIVFGANLRNPVLRGLKARDRRVSRLARPVIVQDDARAELLITENRILRDRILLVPNAPRGDPSPRRTNVLRDRLGIPPRARIVLHLGMMGPEVLSTEMAASTQAWPEDCVLVFHERRARRREDPLVREAAGAGGDRVAFSLEPVELESLPDLVASADVGLVFYNPKMGENFSVITGASGKFSYYLRAGLPVVCLDLPGFREIVDEYGCGLCVSAPEGIGAALGEILSDPERYRAGARRCFEERFDFDRHFAQVVEQIKHREPTGKGGQLDS
jgi:glycosyltransferase involved in cell wall biosynthesis